MAPDTRVGSWPALREAHLAETGWLEQEISAGNPVLRIVDMRGQVHKTTIGEGVQRAEYLGAKAAYDSGHIPGAVYLDWTSDLVDAADPVPAQAAGADKVKQVLESAGIGDDSVVVAYDAHPASQFAARLWWLLRYYGHDQVRVLNGGWSKWTGEGRPVTLDPPTHQPATFTPRIRPEWRVTAEQLSQSLADGSMRLVDARDEEQYIGRVRRGARGGHIPGAVHLPAEAVIAEDGTFRAPQELDRLAAERSVRPDTRVVAYCNGGVAATSVLFSLSMLGYPRLANYDGSWNEWSERPDLPVER